jgi:hypothetical protein
MSTAVERMIPVAEKKQSALVFNEMTYCRKFFNDPYYAFMVATLFKDGLRHE